MEDIILKLGGWRTLKILQFLTHWYYHSCVSECQKSLNLVFEEQGAKKFKIQLLEELTFGLKTNFWRSLTFNFTDIKLIYLNDLNQKISLLQ